MTPALLKHSSPSRKQPAADFINEPPTDFSRLQSRNAMTRALAEFSAKPCAEYPLLIANRPIFTGQWIESINPSHKSRIVARCPCALAEHAEQAVAAAKATLGSWRDAAAADRASLLDRVAGILRRD